MCSGQPLATAVLIAACNAAVSSPLAPAHLTSYQGRPEQASRSPCAVVVPPSVFGPCVVRLVKLPADCAAAGGARRSAATGSSAASAAAENARISDRLRIAGCRSRWPRVIGGLLRPLPDRNGNRTIPGWPLARRAT